MKTYLFYLKAPYRHYETVYEHLQEDELFDEHFYSEEGHLLYQVDLNNKSNKFINFFHQIHF